jgi:DNA-binding NtrC family response regulator
MASRVAEDAIDSRSRKVDCVFLSCFDHNVRFFASMLCIEGIRLHCACTVEMADFLLLATRGTVFVTDTAFLDGSWQDALAMTRTVHPLVATLICADPTDRQFVAGAQERGALDVLWKPLALDRLRSSIRVAHELTSERHLWAAERKLERRSHQGHVPGFCLEAVE